LKKRSKKLLFNASCGSSLANGTRAKSFLLLFFKKEALFFTFHESWIATLRFARLAITVGGR
jgi:hypothetical protein